MPSSTQGDILEAIKTTISGLSLTGITTNVLIRKFPFSRDGVTLPLVAVCPVPETMPNTGTNLADDTTFKVMVSAIRVSNQSLTLEDNDQLLEWREKIRQAFREKRITGVTGSYRTTVEPGPVFDPTAFQNQLDATTLFLLCTVRENRT